MKKYKALPRDLQKAMFSSVTAGKILEIEQKHSLSIDQAGILAQEVGWVLLGEKRASEFPNNLAGALKIPEARAREIARDVNHTIFFQIRESLKRLHGVSQTEALIPEAPKEIRPAPSAPGAPPLDDKTYWETLKQETKETPASIAPAPAPSTGAKVAKPFSETKPPLYDLAEKPVPAFKSPAARSLEDEVSQLIPIIPQTEASRPPVMPPVPAQKPEAEEKPEIKPEPKPSPAAAPVPAETKAEQPISPAVSKESAPPAAPAPLPPKGGTPLYRERDPYREPVE